VVSAQYGLNSSVEDVAAALRTLGGVHSPATRSPVPAAVMTVLQRGRPDRGFPIAEQNGSYLCAGVGRRQ
jgi:hypothetical protein